MGGCPSREWLRRKPEEIIDDLREKDPSLHFLSVRMSIRDWWKVRKQMRRNGVKTSTICAHISDKQFCGWITERKDVSEVLDQKIALAANLGKPENHEQRFAEIAKAVLQVDELRGPKNLFERVRLTVLYIDQDSCEVKKVATPIWAAYHLYLPIDEAQFSFEIVKKDKKKKEKNGDCAVDSD
eukprot:g18238.t1